MIANILNNPFFVFISSIASILGAVLSIIFAVKSKNHAQIAKEEQDRIKQKHDVQELTEIVHIEKVAMALAYELSTKQLDQYRRGTTINKKEQQKIFDYTNAMYKISDKFDNPDKVKELCSKAEDCFRSFLSETTDVNRQKTGKCMCDSLRELSLLRQQAFENSRW